MAAQIQWHFSGDYFENCNCSVVCPCLISKSAPLTSRPTEGVCDVPLIFHIESGSYDGMALDGLNVALAVHTPGPMAEGNWSVAAYIDQRANDKQTEALGAIFTGAAGGPMAHLAPLIGKNLGVSKVPITYQSKVKSVQRRSPASYICPLIRCLPRIPAERCGPTPAIRLALTSWHWPWERRGIRLTITGCAGIILARTDTTRRSAGQIIPDVTGCDLPSCADRGPLTMSGSVLEAVLRRDRAIIIAALSVLTVLAWTDLVWLANDMAMGGMDMTGFRMIPAGQGLMMPASEPWKPIEFGYMFAMWAVMMIGMMTPSVAPMILIYARVGRQARMDGKPFAATAWFAGGYLLAWTAFSLAATSAQWALERATLLTPMMVSASNILGGVVLIVAGLYQWTPLKEACLSHCQAPLTFILGHGGFRSDPTGALTLGLRHGLYCIGCCWALMALLFVGGVMNFSGSPRSQSLCYWRKSYRPAGSSRDLPASPSWRGVDGC